LRIVSVMIAISFFILFFGILAAIGVRHHAGRGYYQGFMDTVFMFENIIILMVFVVALVLLYVYTIIEVGVNIIAKKLKLMIRFLVHPVQYIKSRKREDDRENTQNKEEQQKAKQAEKGFFSNVWTRYNDVVAGMTLQFESVFQEIRDKQAKPNHADLKNESEEKDTNELGVDTEETALLNLQEEKEAQVKKVEKEKIE